MKKRTTNNTIAFDIGVASIGWAVINQRKGKLVDFGVRKFDEAKSAQVRRYHRASRRNVRRRVWRKNQMIQAFLDFGLLTRNEVNQKGYLCYSTNSDLLAIHRPKPETVHHLRMYALEHEVSNRELLLCLYNICKTRGHFLMEDIDFSDDDTSITFESFKNRFYEITNPYFMIEYKSEFENTVLQKLFEEGKISCRSMKDKEFIKLFEISYTGNEKDDERLKILIRFLSGYKVEIESAFGITEEIKKRSLQDFRKSEDELPEFFQNLISLNDMMEIYSILKEDAYICQYYVKQLEEVKKIQKLYKENPNEYEKRKKNIRDKMKVKERTLSKKEKAEGKKLVDERIRMIRNVENNRFPNGLFVREARAILKKQQEFNAFISDEFIEVCISILKARIPYYIGPLSESATNTWITRDSEQKFQYSYEWTQKHEHLVDEFTTVEAWKKAMISRCTYFPEEYALPKGSFLGEVYSLINEINILEAIDLDGNSYLLTMEDKIKALDTLFLQKTKVSYQDLADCLTLSSFGPRNCKSKKEFNNSITLYHNITHIVPSLKFNSILELLNGKEEGIQKLNAIEDVILTLNLFEEKSLKKEEFVQNKGYDEIVASRLSNLTSKGYYRVSKKLILETPIDQEGHCLLEKLFENNTDSYANEQMTLIHNAVDAQGNPISLNSNKYVHKLMENNALSIDLLIEHGKPFIPMSRETMRALNECFKVYNEIIKQYGVPKRLVIETAKDLKDSNVIKMVPAKHFDEMEKGYQMLQTQITELKNKDKNMNLSFGLADWETISQYLVKNKRKIELYIRQNGKDMITGDPIDINHLESYEIDHILPRGFGDNSMDNSMLIDKTINGLKGNRVPLEYIESECVKNKKGFQITSSDFKHRVQQLYELKMISEKKVQQLLLESTEDAIGFINRNLVDTRYIIREFMSILQAYHRINEFDTHIIALKAAFTSVYRNAFGIHKNRDNGCQHHAYDAATVAITDHVLSTYYPNYDRRGNNKVYQSLIERINENLTMDKGEQNKLKHFIQYAYKETYGNFPNDNDSLITELKKRTPLFSQKNELKYTGQFFDATILKQKEKKDTNVLSILEINDNEKVFTGVQCCAVDFYQYKDKKGKRHHVAIHIPKVIVHDNGTIDEQKYLDLIRYHYKINELLNEHGELKTNLFRFRCFKNDVMYDTNSQEMYLFNLGSIENRTIEIKHIDVFSYQQLLEKRVEILKFLKENNLQVKDLTEFAFEKETKTLTLTEEFSTLIDVLIREYSKKEKINLKSIKSKITSCHTGNQIVDYLSYLCLVIQRTKLPKSIIGQNIQTTNNIGCDAQYIKLKYSPLGIRWHINQDGKIDVQGPNGHTNLFSKIKVEQFSYKLLATSNLRDTI